MSAQHTPGPWHRNIPPASKYPTVWAGRNTHVAAISPGAPRRSGNGCSMSEEEQEANINLIAAAPEILAALKVMVEAYGEAEVDAADQPSMVREAMRAIAKAEGRS